MHKFCDSDSLQTHDFGIHKIWELLLFIYVLSEARSYLHLVLIFRNKIRFYRPVGLKVYFLGN